MADAADASPEGCDVVAVSSRACERGTKGCETRHLPDGTSPGAPTTWTVLRRVPAPPTAPADGAAPTQPDADPGIRWTPLADAPAEWIGQRVWMMRGHWVFAEIRTLPPMGELPPEALAGTWVAPLSLPGPAVPGRPAAVPPEE